MKELTVEEKIAKIKNTNSYQDVKNAWFPPYHEKEYYFVSYSHKDYKLVYESLHRLQSGEKRLDLWYDHSLVPGRDWEIEARRYIYDFNCKGVIFFLSENAVLSRSIHKEIELVKESGKEYLSINLPCEKIEGHIGECLSAVKMLELLKQQGYTIENYEEKAAVLGATFNDNVIYLSFNEDINTQIEKILSLKRQPLLEFDKKLGIVVSIHNLNAEDIKEDDFKYWDDNGKYIFAKEIGDCAFANCRWLNKIELPKSISSIGDFAFYNCTSLKSIAIPRSVTSIGDGAFNGCASLKSVMIPYGVTSISDEQFKGCGSLESITIPDSVTSIGDGAFYGCTSLKSIAIPRSVTSISDRAFFWCVSLKSITIPDSVTSIGDGAFHGCTSLKSITIPEGVISIGGFAFWLCGSLERITIPDKISSIGTMAFCYCTNLKSIFLFDNVTSISCFAFAKCNNLKDIFYAGKKQQWISIHKDDDWDDDTPDYIVHCADGDLKKGGPID